MYRFMQKNVPAAAAASGCEHRGMWHRGMRHRFCAGLWAAAMLWLLVGGLAQAQVPYAADPAFANGQWIGDAFWSNQAQANNSFVGRKVARMSNGDLVVAALVKNPNANQTNGFWNIGLVRYNAAGTQRLQWSNVSPVYAGANNEYVIFPKTNTAYFSGIKDIAVIDDKILVAVNHHSGGSDDVDTNIVVFGTDGSFKTNQLIFGNANKAEYVGGMAVYRTGSTPGTSTNHVVVVATEATRPSQGNSIGRPIFTRLTLNASGTMQDVTGRVALNTHWCATITRDCRPADIALGYAAELGVGPSIFVLNRAYNLGWGFVVTRVSGNGVANESWSGMWDEVYETGSGAGGNSAVALAVRSAGGVLGSPRTHTVFVATEIERACTKGMAVKRYNTDGTAPVGGYTIFGGSNATGIGCTAGLNATAYPFDMEINGNRLAVVGYDRWQPQTVLPGQPTPRARDDALVAILDASVTTGAVPLLDFRRYPSPISGSQDTRDTILWGIVPTTEGRFVGVGDVRYRDGVPNINASSQYYVGTLGIAPAGGGNGGLPFSDGFEEPAGGGNNGNPSTGLSALGLAFFDKLFQSQQTRTLVGHQASTIAGVGWRHWQCQNDCSDFRTSANNRHAAVAGWELESRGDEPNETLDYITYDLTFQEALKARNRGAINTFGMHTRRLDNGDGSWAVAPAGHCTQLLPGGTYHAQWNTKLAGYVTQLNKMQQGGQPVPFLFRPFHEADGNWFWWGTTGCSDASFKDLFRYTVQYMRNAGLKHMLVVYAPGIFTTQAQYLARYPGDDVVDVIGFDQYLATPVDPNHGESVAGLTTKLGIVHALAQARGKIAAWAETGQKGVATNNAYSQLAQAITNSGAKLAYVMFWANYTTADNDFYIPYPVSPAAVRADFNGFIAPPRVAAGEFPSVYP